MVHLYLDRLDAAVMPHPVFLNSFLCIIFLSNVTSIPKKIASFFHRFFENGVDVTNVQRLLSSQALWDSR